MVSLKRMFAGAWFRYAYFRCRVCSLSRMFAARGFAMRIFAVAWFRYAYFRCRVVSLCVFSLSRGFAKAYFRWRVCSLKRMFAGAYGC